MNKTIKILLVSMALSELSSANIPSKSEGVKFQATLSAEQLNFLAENGMLKNGDRVVVKVPVKNTKNVNDKSTEFDNHEVYTNGDVIIFAANGWKALD